MVFEIILFDEKEGEYLVVEWCVDNIDCCIVEVLWLVKGIVDVEIVFIWVLEFDYIEVGLMIVEMWVV